MNFYRLQDKPPLESSSTLVYGHSGSGKTTFIGTAGDRTLIINNGKGIDTLYSPGFIRKYGPVNPLVIDVRESGPVSEGASAFNQMSGAISKGFLTLRDDFDNVAIDDGTMMNLHANLKAIEVAAEYRGSKTLGAAKKHNLVVLDVGDYNFQFALLHQFLTWLRDLCKEHNKHLIIAAHIREIYGKLSGPGAEAPLRRVVPSFSGKTFPDSVVALFDNVWKFEVVSTAREPIYRAITIGNEMTVANTSMGGILDEKINNPHFLQLMKKLQEAKAKTK